MPAQALYRKWRPQLWEEVVGQEHVVQTLRNALRGDRVAHAYLFAGPRGCGKTTTARLVAKALNCLHPDSAQRPDNTCTHCVAVNEGRFLDLIEIDGASNNGVENIRELRDKINFAPNEGIYKVYVIDECFRYEDLVTLADGSKVPIGKLVEEKLQVEVLSYNEVTRRIEPRAVVRWMRKTPALPTVRITFDNNRVVVCTMNHKFYTPQGMRHASELDVGQFVYANYERITQHQWEVVAGAAIGDGHLALTDSQMRARLRITQGVDQKSYLDYKVSLLGDLVQSTPRFQLSPKSFSTKGTFGVSTLSRPQIAELHRELYDEGGRKRISRQYLDRITPLGLALWYLDDGSLVTQDYQYKRKKDGGVSHYPTTRSLLSMYGFSVEESRLVMDWLGEKWGIEGGVSATAKGPVIWFTLDGTERLHELIAPYVPPEMSYKLLPAYCDRFCPLADDEQIGGLGVSIVKDIEWVEPPEYVYNIEVADNHNYFVRDILVANCHMLSVGAFNALLKTLEEPPAHAIFILATTESYKIPATVSSRCQRFEFRRIPVTETVARLRALCEQEGLAVDDAALEVVARQATGSLRDAISLLDQLVSADAKVTLAQAQELLGTATGQTVQALVEALAAGDTTTGLNLVNRAIDSGADPRQLARQMVDYLRGLMLVRLGNAALVEAPAETRVTMARQVQSWELSALLRAVRAFNAAANDARGGWQPQLPLELAIVECATPIAAPEAATPTPNAQPAPHAGGAAGREVEPPAQVRPDTGRPGTRSARSSAPKSSSVAASAEPHAIPSAIPEGINLDNLRSAWGQLIQLLLQHKKITKLTATDLEQCSVDGLDGNVMLVSTQSKVFLEKISARPDMHQIMGGLLSDVLGFTCGIKFHLTSGQADHTPDVPPGGMVAAALRDLGGKILE